MKTLLALLLLCLTDPGQSDCQAGCLSCSNFLPRHLTFNTMECLSRCEGDASSSTYLDLCRALLSAHVSSFSRKMQKRSQEEAEALFPEEEEEEEEAEVGQLEGDLLRPVELQRFDHMTQALGEDGRGSRGNGKQLDTGFQSQDSLSVEDKEEEGPSDMAARGQADYGMTLSKRFGGFVKGRHSYRKLVSPGRSYQKRYGGFVGIRKSARKWNNQKRFSEFLKQYLGVSARASDLSSASEVLAQHNQV